MVFSGLPLLPKNWLYMGGQPTQVFARFVGDADYGTGGVLGCRERVRCPDSRDGCPTWRAWW
jgi:hypothetical protein